GILLVVDPNGIIFISNKQDIKLMLMWELRKNEIEKIKLTRQFADIELLWTGFTPLSEGYLFDKNKEKYLYAQMPLDGYKGWKIVHLRNVKEISKEVADPFIKIIGQMIITVSIFIAISVFILYKKALQEIFKRKRVEERTQELKQVQDQLRKLSGNIMATHENERRAVARELHDHLGQILTALKMDGVWLEKHLEPIDFNAAQRANRICSLIDDTIADVRAMAFRLRPGLLDDLGLVDALESLVRDFEKRSEIWFLFRHNEIPEIDDTVSTALYRIAQEALTNALKHSKATEISVDLAATPVAISANALELQSSDSKCHLTLTVEDNGCGFSSVGNKEYHGLGLTGMKERATLAGGTLEIFSAPYKGTKIVCNLISQLDTM
ncbi:MAG: sensor histidine kinase, partial [Desulfamplus sp.]|nr:sensor histidine kinase [Desulfamplus sp.]